VAGAPALDLRGSLAVSGTLDPLSLRGRGDGRIVAEREVPALRWELEAERKEQASRLRLVAVQEGGNRIAADVALGPEQRLDGTVELRVEDAPALQALAGFEDGPEATGRLALGARLSGTLGEPAVEGRIDAARLSVFGASIGDVAGAFAADQKRVRTDGIDVRLAGGGVIHASGTVGLDPAVENSWETRFAQVAIDALAEWARTAAGVSLPVAGGTLSASLRGRGPWRSATLDGTLQAAGFSLAGEPMRRLDVEVSGALPSWKAQAVLLHDERESLTAKLEGRGAQEIAAEVESTAWNLGELAPAAQAGVSGSVRVAGRVSGPPSALDGSVEAMAEDLGLGERRLGDATLTAQASSGRWEARLRLLDGAVQAAAQLLDERRFSVAASWGEASLGALLGEDPTLRLQTSGELQATGSLDAPLALDAKLTIAKLELESGTLAVSNAEPIRVAGSDGRMRIESLRLAGDDTTVEAAGSFTTAGAVDVDVSGSGSLHLVDALVESIQTRGRFAVSLDVTRAAGGEPSLDGRLSLTDAAVEFGQPVGPSHTAAEISFDGSRIRIEKLSGNIGGGTFSAGGSLGLEEGLDLGWQIEEVSTGMVPSLEHELSGRGTVQGSWRDLTVAGEIEILQALYDRDIGIARFLPSFQRSLPEAPEADEEGGGAVVNLAVRVFAPDELFIDNNFARIEAQMDLAVSGTASDPRLEGQVQVISGEVYFRDRTFDVVTAVIDFRPELGFDAHLNIVAETEVATTEGTYTVRLQVTGTTSDARVVMSADDPSLTQNDVASLIAFGKTVAQLQQEGGGVSIGDVLALAPTGRAEEGAARFFRLDRVDIEPTFDRSSGEFQPQVTLAKSFTDDISASLASTFGAAASQLLKLTYQLTARISLLAEWETESQNRGQAIGGGVRYRVQFRDTPGVSLLDLGAGRAK
jgi:autotransporter translocation and assembly factor TamB